MNRNDFCDQSNSDSWQVGPCFWFLWSELLYRWLIRLAGDRVLKGSDLQPKSSYLTSKINHYSGCFEIYQSSPYQMNLFGEKTFDLLKEQKNMLNMTYCPQFSRFVIIWCLLVIIPPPPNNLMRDHFTKVAPREISNLPSVIKNGSVEISLLVDRWCAGAFPKIEPAEKSKCMMNPNNVLILSLK